MRTSALPPNDKQDVGLAYTKRLHGAKQLQLLAQSAAIVTYGCLGLQKWAAQSAEDVTNLFFLQVALCWVPLWGACTICALPTSWYAWRLDRQFGLSKVGLHGHARDFAKTSALSFVLGCTVLEVAFGSNRLAPKHGWLLAASLCTLLLLGVSRSLPRLLSLFYPVAPLNDAPLRERLASLAAKAGIRLGTVYEWRISARTRRANAFVSGVGAARRIVVTDTLLTELSHDEVEAIVAHELGHGALHHVWKRVLLQGVIFSVIFWVINAAVSAGHVWLADENMGWADLKLVPGLLMFGGIGYFYANLVMTAVSRRQEEAADLYSWKLMGTSQPFITAMHKLTQLNLVVFNRGSRWSRSHPATADRIAAAEQYATARTECSSDQAMEARSGS